MVVFHEFIRDARKRLGFQTAKEFHRVKSAEVNDFSMSYETYSNLEAGKYLPPADKLNGLAQALEVPDLKAFIFSYCFSLMPNEFFKSFFIEADGRVPGYVVRSDSAASYKEKFLALMQYNQMQSKYELTPEQISYLETDLVAWDIYNLYISAGNLGFSLQEIAEKTGSDLESTRYRVEKLCELKVLKQLPSEKYLVTQDALIIPRKPIAKQLTFGLIQRDTERCFQDDRNHPYTRFRLMSFDPNDRDQIEMIIDDFMLEMRRFKKPGGETHYLQVLFSDRKDLL